MIYKKLLLIGILGILVLVSGCIQESSEKKNPIFSKEKFSCENDNSNIQSRGYVILMGLADHTKEGWISEKKLMEKDPKAKFVLIYDQDENSRLEDISQKFLDDIHSLLKEKPVDELVIFGSSAGGVTASYSIAKLNFQGPVALHTMASPLNGYDLRGFGEAFIGEGRSVYEKEIALGLEIFKKPGKNVGVYHHKTVTDTVLKDHYCREFSAFCDPIKIQDNNIEGSKEFYYPQYDHNPLGAFVIRDVLKCYNPEIVEDIEEENRQADRGEKLGSLCSGEDSCQFFCNTNRGRCTDYCQNNPENPLCQKLFGQVPEVNREATKQLCISNTKPLFTKPFTDLTNINHITPIGNVNAGSLSRSYIAVKAYPNGTGIFVPLYSPTNATLFRIAYAYRGDPSKGARAEYRLDFRVSCEVTFAFDHIAEISDKLKQFAPTEPAYTTRSDREISVPISEGEYLGSTNGGLAGKAWDFLLFNYAKEVLHINPSRWASDHNKYADCPYDYFTEDLKKQYYSMFTSAGGEKGELNCRSASRDIAGALSGGWFKEKDDTDSKGTRLVVASDYSTVDLVIDQEATDLARLLALRHQNPPVKPEDVKVGQSVCYFDSEKQQHAFLKLLTEVVMASHIGSGPCPSSLPENHETWER